MTAKWSAATLIAAFALSSASPARAEWVAKESPSGNSLVQVQCLTTTNCWIAGVGGVVLHSTDGGEHWDEVQSGAPANKGAWNSVSFADENAGWFAGLRVISRTPDAGKTWVGAGLGGGSLDDPPFQNALWAVSSQVAWAVGADLWDVGGGKVLGVPSFWLHSVDANGKLQDYVEWGIPTLGGIFYDVEFVGTEDAWAVGYSDQPVPSGIIYRVQKASAKDPLITAQAFGQALSLEGISMLDKQEGFIVGEAGLIMHTKNGGVTWTSQPSGITDDLWDVHFVDADHGWAVGEAGMIASTKNGGSSWQKTTWSEVDHLVSVHFLSTDFGLAVGTSGTILKWAEPPCGVGTECQAGAGGDGSAGSTDGVAGGDGDTSGGSASGGSAETSDVSGADPAAGSASVEAGAGGERQEVPGGAPSGDGGTASSNGGSSKLARESEGCGCEVTSGSGPSGALALALAGLALLRRARRSRLG